MLYWPSCISWTTLDLPPQNDQPSGLLNIGVMALRGLHVMWIPEWEFVSVSFGVVVIAFASLSFWGRHGGVRRGGWGIQDEQGSEKDLKSIVFFFLMLRVPGSELQ